MLHRFLSNSDLSVRLKSDCPSGNGILRMPGGTDCHTSDIGHWFAMTYYWLQEAANFLRKVTKTTVIANQSADWCGNPFLRNA